MSEQREETWFLRRQGTVHGPYSNERIMRYVRRGELQRLDELSPDGQRWGPVADFPQLAPEPEEQAESRPAGQEKRRPMAPAVVDEEARDAARRATFEAVQRQEVRGNWHAWINLAILVGVLGGVGWVFTLQFEPGIERPPVDCNADAAPRVNWENCVLGPLRLGSAPLHQANLKNAQAQGADLKRADLREAELSYVQLLGADLSFAYLTQARLVGADLRRTNLGYADLREADLSFADLRGARLDGAKLDGVRFDQALWLDGQRCAPGSVGGCVPLPP